MHVLNLCIVYVDSGKVILYNIIGNVKDVFDTNTNMRTIFGEYPTLKLIL